jgi:hypothetical protein
MLKLSRVAGTGIESSRLLVGWPAYYSPLQCFRRSYERGRHLARGNSYAIVPSVKNHKIEAGFEPSEEAKPPGRHSVPDSNV